MRIFPFSSSFCVTFKRKPAMDWYGLSCLTRHPPVMSTKRTSNRPKRPRERSGSEPFLLAELIGFLTAVAIAAINLSPKPAFAIIWPGPIAWLLILLAAGTLLIAPPLAILSISVCDRPSPDVARSFGSRLGFRSSIAFLLSAFGLIGSEQLLHAAGWSSSLLGAIPPTQVFAVIAMVGMPVLALASFSTSVCMWLVFSLGNTDQLDTLVPDPPSKPQVSVFPLIAAIGPTPTIPRRPLTRGRAGWRSKL